MKNLLVLALVYTTPQTGYVWGVSVHLKKLLIGL